MGDRSRTADISQPASPKRDFNLKRIGINGHLLSGEAGYRRAGIHQYIAQVLNHLPVDQAIEYQLFSRQIDEDYLRKGFVPVQSHWPTERRIARILWEQLAWPLLAHMRKLDLLHSMAFVTPLVAPCPTVVTVYDLSFIRFPERFPAWQRFYLTSQTRRSCRQARRIIAISEASRQDIHQVFGVPLEKITAVQPGVESVYRPLPATDVATFRAREQLPERFILHVGTLQPRKNIPVLLAALARLGRPDLHLILVGGKGWLYEDIFRQVTSLGLKQQDHFTGYVGDGLLPLWYNAADLLVLPSVYEGFGLPILEAMACGTPVVAASSSSLPEAGGEAARYFAPHDAAELADQLATVLDNPRIAAEMRECGLRQAARFSWVRAGEETAAVYRQALAGSLSFTLDKFDTNDANDYQNS
jgi:glycosyltransferase involved in cell wall biosynthesis